VVPLEAFESEVLHIDVLEAGKWNFLVGGLERVSEVDDGCVALVVLVVVVADLADVAAGQDSYHSVTTDIEPTNGVATRRRMTLAIWLAGAIACRQANEALGEESTMLMEVTCRCGWAARGSEREVITELQRHAKTDHDVDLTPDDVRKRWRVVEPGKSI
jgi:predicted small metal-binding protein